MSARSGLTRIAEERGWTVADNGRFASFSKGDRFISVTWSVRGTVTTAKAANGGDGRIAVGSEKFEWVREELMKDA